MTISGTQSVRVLPENISSRPVSTALDSMASKRVKVFLFSDSSIFTAYLLNNL
jgi:hypothetical protein